MRKTGSEFRLALCDCGPTLSIGCAPLEVWMSLAPDEGPLAAGELLRNRGVWTAASRFSDWCTTTYHRLLPPATRQTLRPAASRGQPRPRRGPPSASGTALGNVLLSRTCGQALHHHCGLTPMQRQRAGPPPPAATPAVHPSVQGLSWPPGKSPDLTSTPARPALHSQGCQSLQKVPFFKMRAARPIIFYL